MPICTLVFLSCGGPIPPRCGYVDHLAELTYRIPEGAEAIGEDVLLVVRGDQAILHWRDAEGGEHQVVYDVVGLE
ncbi:hypothetical protein L6R53_09970 [Myxococcota bacterium]|nr:hypothetical protein [Myxococcota bacterium]